MNTDKTPPFERPNSQTEQREIDLRSLLLAVYEDKWLITIITGVIFCFIAGYLLLKPSRYESNALIQIENKSTNLGQLDSGTSLFDMKASRSDVQKALMSSRFVLEPVVNRLNLNIIAEPQYFPLIKFFIQKHPTSALAKPWRGLSRFAWGGEKIQVNQFNIPHDFLKLNFTIIAKEANTYELYDSDNHLLLTGHVGALASSKPGSNIPVSILISSLMSNPGAKFHLQKIPTNEIVEKLQKELTINDVGSSQINNKTGILQISLIGTDPKKLVSIINMITNVAFQEDTKNKSIEAAKTLAFLNQQLPQIKNSLNQAEVSLNDYRAKNGKLNLPAETHILLEQMADIEKKISETRLKRIELLQYYTQQHPFILEIDSRQNKLQEELLSLQGTMKKLPAQDQIALRLARDVRVKSELYLLLAKKMQELQVIAAGTVSDIRILSFAKNPDEPLSNRTLLKLVASFFVALGCGFFTALLRRALHQKVQDPLWIEQNLGIITAAIIPYSKKQNNIDRLLKKGLIGQSNILAFNAPHDLSIEALRSLRTHLQFSLQSSTNNIIAITGISPEIGKSFVASNFAYILADAGKRILLIDADIRRGHLFRYFNLNKSPGLSEVLTGTMSLQNAIQTLESPNLHILSSGAFVGKPSELLMNERFNDIIEQVSKDYDAVVIDTAPILAVTDGVIVAKHAGINFLLIGSGMHHAEEIEFGVKRLYANNVKIQGVIYNNVQGESRTYGYGKYRYRYYYNYENA